jgi:DNA ligase (NAD+)
MEGFGEKSITKLGEAIEKSKKQPLHRLIFALGIRFVGETTAKTLAQPISHLLDLRKYSIEELQSLEDIGPKVAGSIHQFFSNRENIQMLEKLEKLGVQMKNLKKEMSRTSGLAGQTFLFTGTLPTLKRSEAEALAEEHGGQVISGVSAKLNYLVVGEDAGSKLEKAKKLNSVKIISEADFLRLLGKK